MRLQRFLNEGKMVSKALALPEPEDGDHFTDEEVKKYLGIIDQALEELGDSDDKATLAVRSDLIDKKEKWKNWKDEVKPDGPTDSEPIKIAKIMAPPDPKAEEK